MFRDENLCPINKFLEYFLIFSIYISRAGNCPDFTAYVKFISYITTAPLTYNNTGVRGRVRAQIAVVVV